MSLGFGSQRPPSGSVQALSPKRLPLVERGTRSDGTQRGVGEPAWVAPAQSKPEGSRTRLCTQREPSEPTSDETPRSFDTFVVTRLNLTQSSSGVGVASR